MTAIWFRPRRGLGNGKKFDVQWNLSVTTTFLLKFITCDLFSNVFSGINLLFLTIAALAT